MPSSPLPAVALRFFNVFGPRQDPQGPYAAAVPKLLEAALAGTPLPIHGDGLQTRDFIFVEDITSALAGTVWGYGGGTLPDQHIRQAGLDPANPAIAQAVALA
ncbi:MAG: NAD-dependent epimerase/dehydratase family protein, partial [Verrucomicrobia bacterium]|nr:NAD-dependent epimerase/dehydratase family protein [Verrucomicrobiota bacterium]